MSFSSNGHVGSTFTLAGMFISILVFNLGTITALAPHTTMFNSVMLGALAGKVRKCFKGYYAYSSLITFIVPLSYPLEVVLTISPLPDSTLLLPLLHLNKKFLSWLLSARSSL